MLHSRSKWPDSPQKLQILILGVLDPWALNRGWYILPTCAYCRCDWGFVGQKLGWNYPDDPNLLYELEFEDVDPLWLCEASYLCLIFVQYSCTSLYRFMSSNATFFAKRKKFVLKLENKSLKNFPKPPFKESAQERTPTNQKTPASLNIHTLNNACSYALTERVDVHDHYRDVSRTDLGNVALNATKRVVRVGRLERTVDLTKMGQGKIKSSQLYENCYTVETYCFSLLLITRLLALDHAMISLSWSACNRTTQLSRNRTQTLCSFKKLQVDRNKSIIWWSSSPDRLGRCNTGL